jgi:hypothetical protein
MLDKMAERQMKALRSKASWWRRIYASVLPLLPEWLVRRTTSERGRDLVLWLEDADRRRAPTQEVEAHLREIGMPDEIAAVIRNEYMSRLHKRR